MSEDFNSYPRADTFSIENDHNIYDVYVIPGMRRSGYYGGNVISGPRIEKTYNLTESDRDYPPDNEAIPSLKDVDDGIIMSKNITYSTKMCPECDGEIDGRKNPRSGEVSCPECGMILRGNKLSRTPSSAEQFQHD